jgi:hypothetical protein
MTNSIHPPASSGRRRPEKATYDASNWPVLLVTLSAESMTRPEFDRHLDRLESFFERGRFGLVIDVRAGGVLNATERKVLAAWFDDVVQRYPGRLASLGVVLSSPIQRGIFKALSWLTTSPFEREACAELEPATKWAYACARVSDHPIRHAR